MCGGSSVSPYTRGEQLASTQSTIDSLSKPAKQILKQMARFGSKLVATRGGRTGNFKTFTVGKSNPTSLTEKKFNELYDNALIGVDYDSAEGYVSFYDNVVSFKINPITKEAMQTGSTKSTPEAVLA